MPLLVGMEQNLGHSLSMGEANGRDILRQLLRVPRWLASMPEDVALEVLRVSGNQDISAEGDKG